MDAAHTTKRPHTFRTWSVPCETIFLPRVGCGKPANHVNLDQQALEHLDVRHTCIFHVRQHEICTIHICQHERSSAPHTPPVPPVPGDRAPVLGEPIQLAAVMLVASTLWFAQAVYRPLRKV